MNGIERRRLLAVVAGAACTPLSAGCLSGPPAGSSGTFELDADQLAPTNAIEGTDLEGDTLVARSTRGDPDDEDHRLGAFELERVDEPDGESRRLIVEQVVRSDRLRDALALALDHDVDRVRLEEYDATHPIVGHDSDRTVEFRGSYYRISTRELEDEE